MVAIAPQVAWSHPLHHRHHYVYRSAHADAYAPTYYDLPFRGELPAGTAEILRPHCDDGYPMHEQFPCGTATGGPVGGLGS